MDASTFDRLTRTLFRTTSRRAALGVLLASAGGALGLGVPPPATAQGCKANRERCGSDAACCSGRCTRRRQEGPRVCRQADNQGECTVEQDVCAGNNTHCGTNSSADLCFCFVTTTGRSFCGASVGIPAENCDCASNEECADRFGQGAKCVATGASGFITCQTCREEGGTGCVLPCPNLDPVP
jgi:hypothetical protein